MMTACPPTLMNACVMITCVEREDNDADDASEMFA
jgi:hypothetical protein